MDNEITRLGEVLAENQEGVQEINTRLDQDRERLQGERQQWLGEMQKKLIQKANELFLQQIALLEATHKEASTGANVGAATAATTEAAAALLERETDTCTATLRQQADSLGERAARQAQKAQEQYEKLCASNKEDLNEFRGEFYKWWTEEKMQWSSLKRIGSKYAKPELPMHSVKRREISPRRQ